LLDNTNSYEFKAKYKEVIEATTHYADI
jgi:hypothetical protein